jgi:hypothetical protein
MGGKSYLVIANSTVSGNSANTGGGISGLNSTVSLSSATIAFNGAIKTGAV